MSLLENNSVNRMTLDNRTFLECSLRMQSITPTLPRKQNQRQNDDINSKINSLPNIPGVTCSEILKPSTRPIPPPRKRKPVASTPTPTPSLTGSDAEFLAAGSKLGQDEETNDGHGGKTTLNARRRGGAEDEENENEVHAGGREIKNVSKNGRKRGSNVTLKRPVKYFLDWMTNIANNVQFHDYDFPHS